MENDSLSNSCILPVSIIIDYTFLITKKKLKLFDKKSLFYACISNFVKN